MIVLAAAVAAQADEPDAIRVELNKAKQTFADTTGKAKATLLASIDDTIKTVPLQATWEGKGRKEKGTGRKRGLRRLARRTVLCPNNLNKSSEDGYV